MAQSYPNQRNLTSSSKRSRARSKSGQRSKAWFSDYPLNSGLSMVAGPKSKKCSQSKRVLPYTFHTYSEHRSRSSWGHKRSRCLSLYEYLTHVFGVISGVEINGNACFGIWPRNYRSVWGQMRWKGQILTFIFLQKHTYLAPFCLRIPMMWFVLMFDVLQNRQKLLSKFMISLHCTLDGAIR